MSAAAEGSGPKQSISDYVGQMLTAMRAHNQFHDGADATSSISLNLPLLAARACEFAERFHAVMAGADRKLIAMQVCREAFAGLIQSERLDANTERLLGDLIDCLIAVHNNQFTFGGGSNSGEQDEKCSGLKRLLRACCGSDSSSSSKSMISVDERIQLRQQYHERNAVRIRKQSERGWADLLSGAAGTYLDVARTIAEVCSFMESEKQMTGAEKRRRAIEMVRNLLVNVEVAAQRVDMALPVSQISDQLIGDCIDVVVAVHNGTLMAVRMAEQTPAGKLCVSALARCCGGGGSGSTN